jgi:hypothetical protein
MYPGPEVTVMKFSAQIQKTFERALLLGDSEEIVKRLDAEVHAQYFDLVNVDDPSGAFLAGAEAEATARMQGLQVFVTEFDGNGCWTFAGHSEGRVIAALADAACEIERS